jgi:hypothetical protein
MLTYLAGDAITLTIPLINEAGTAIVPTAALYKVLDEDSVTIVDATSLSVTGATTQVVITVPGVNNTLAIGRSVGAREVQILVTTATGHELVYAGYRIVVADRLVVPSASVQSYASAEMTAADLNGIPGWTAADKSSRVGALLEAHRHLCLFSYRYIPDDWQSRILMEVDIKRLNEVTLSEWQALPIEFQTALRIAQVYEADEILSSSTSADPRDSGIIAERIGETEVKWRTSKNARYGITDRAYSALSRYVVSGSRLIGRA